MLNNRAIVKTVVSVIRECDNRPISIGIHGDWGAGKSSVLFMVEDEFSKNDEENIVCIRFNGWQHQGFEDAKIALMSAIISKLSENQSLATKSKDIIKKLWKNINWLSVAKTVGSVALAMATGTPPINLVTDTVTKVKDNINNKTKVLETIENVGEYLSSAKVFEDNSLAKEFAEFQTSFEQLLEESKIKKLIVLIDDLDRCLPKVTIETLEAIRLFMFTKSTAFVIAADEAMIQYAVKNHFPNFNNGENSGSDYDYSRRYLEKLIQVPFNIPVLGEVESSMYITLLMICSKISDEENDEFKKLLNLTIDKMKKPWINTGFTSKELESTLGETFKSVKN
jgi:predicted KAP-like P-loop ATPase